MGRSGDDDFPRPKVDERDLGVRPEAAGLLALADKIDAEKAAIAKGLEPTVALAVEAARRGDHLAAAEIFERIAGEWTRHAFRLEAEYWHRRAADAHTANRLKKKRSRKGPQ